MPNIPAIDKTRLFTDPSLFTTSNRGRENITHIVLHHTGYEDVNFVIQTYADAGVSAHYVIDFEGNIIQLVSDKDIAYHAGISRWRNVDGLNKRSIGIEFLTPNPYQTGFSQKQIQSGVILCQYLMCEYNIGAGNVVPHSDIAYDKAGLLNRKQDTSYLFPWKTFAEAGIGIYPNCKLDPTITDRILFRLNDSYPEIITIRQKLAKIGYKVDISKETYDEELARAIRCFNRHYNPKPFATDPDHSETEDYIPPLNGDAYQFWLSSQLQLDYLYSEISKVKKNSKLNPNTKKTRDDSQLLKELPDISKNLFFLNNNSGFDCDPQPQPPIITC
jgi:N-acetyl-anhydromuramyl-L-alanine amidase AmpD